METFGCPVWLLLQRPSFLIMGPDWYFLFPIIVCRSFICTWSFNLPYHYLLSSRRAKPNKNLFSSDASHPSMSYTYVFQFTYSCCLIYSFSVHFFSTILFIASKYCLCFHSFTHVALTAHSNELWCSIFFILYLTISFDPLSYFLKFSFLPTSSYNIMQ